MNTTARWSSLALAAVFTLAMLLGVDRLASVDSGAEQIAQRSATPHS